MKRINAHTTKSFLVPTIVIICWVALNFILFYPAKNGLGDFFSVTVMFIITEYTMLIAGIVVLVLRLFKVIKSGHSFLVTFTMETNILIAILSILLYILHKSDLVWVNRSLLNLLVGVLLLADFVLFKKTKSIS